MVEEGMSFAPDSGLNTVNAGSEGKEVTQEDMVRVSESMRKAAQMGGQIRDDQHKNSQIAKFLEFLFNEVRSDEIREMTVNLCTRPDGLGKGLTLSLHELIAFYMPFFPREVEQYGIENIVQGVPHSENLNIDGYSAYVNHLRKQFPFIEQMDISTLATLAVSILEYFGYVQIEEGKKQETIDSVQGFISL